MATGATPGVADGMWDVGAVRAEAAGGCRMFDSAEAGLSARALSALEPLGVVTVADLVAVDPVRLNRLSGVAETTRREVKARARQWRDKFGLAVTGRGQDRRTALGSDNAELPDPVAAAELLLAHAGTVRAASRRATARLLLG